MLRAQVESLELRIWSLDFGIKGWGLRVEVLGCMSQMRTIVSSKQVSGLSFFYRDALVGRKVPDAHSLVVFFIGPKT